ncbi:C-type lectin domain family 17, member A, partial [Orchesella cincta]
ESRHFRKLGTVEGKTYFEDVTLRSWNASRAFCEKRGLEFGTITSRAEANFLQSSHIYSGWYWVAGKDLQDDGRFSWVTTGEAANAFRFGNWWHSEDNEHCLVYDPPSRFFKRACYHGHYTLCETFDQIQTKSNQSGKAGLINLGAIDGWSYYGDTIPRDWDDAKEYCEDNEMKLATIRGKSQVDFLKEACREIEYDGWYWISGMKLEDGTKYETWHTEDRCPSFGLLDEHYYQHHCYHKHFVLCESVVEITSSTHEQISSTTQPANTDEISVVLATSSKADRETEGLSELTAAVIGTEQSVFAVRKQMQINSLAESGAVLGAIDEKVYFGDAVLRNWTQALKYCEKHGMRLGTITNQAQVNLLKSAFNSISFNGLYWIAGKDVGGDGIFTWIHNGESVETFDNLGWEILNNEDELDLHCLAYSADDNESWNYFRGECSEKIFTLCETIPSIPNKSIVTTILVVIVTTILFTLAIILLLPKAIEWIRARWLVNRQVPIDLSIEIGLHNVLLTAYKTYCKMARSLYLVQIVLQVFIVLGLTNGQNNEASYFTNGLSDSQFTNEDNDVFIFLKLLVLLENNDSDNKKLF